MREVDIGNIVYIDLVKVVVDGVKCLIALDWNEGSKRMLGRGGEERELGWV